MRLRFASLCFKVVGIFLSFHAMAEDTVTICDSCTTAIQFQNAARSAVSGARLNSEVLVVNPVTEQAIWVSVLPRTGGVNRISEASGNEVLPGELAALSPDDGIIRGTVELERVGAPAASGYDFINRELTEGEKQEVGDVIKLSGKDQIIILPQDNGQGFYESYSGSINEGAKLYVFSRINSSYGGILATALASRIRQLLVSRLRTWFGKPARVCSIYNNGDSVCWEIDLVCPSCNSSIRGTAKDANGNVLPPTGGGITQGDGLTVIPGNGMVHYGPAGAIGSKSEVWLFCGYVNGRILSCYLQKF